MWPRSQLKVLSIQSEAIRLIYINCFGSLLYERVEFVLYQVITMGLKRMQLLQIQKTYSREKELKGLQAKNKPGAKCHNQKMYKIHTQTQRCSKFFYSCAKKSISMHRKHIVYASKVIETVFPREL